MGVVLRPLVQSASKLSISKVISLNENSLLKSRLTP
jgi:hypothetical protein